MEILRYISVVAFLVFCMHSPIASAAPKSVTDEVKLVGNFSAVNAAVLISGRYKDKSGTKGCKYWNSYTSTSDTISNIDNYIGNALFDGCDSEIAIFSENSAAMLVKPEGRWTKGADSFSYAIGPPREVPTSVWIVYSGNSYKIEESKMKKQFQFANTVLSESLCGISIGPVTYYDRTSRLDNSEQKLGCGKIDSILKEEIGYHKDRMNVYVVKRLQATDRAGVACTAESDNVIVIDAGRSTSTLIHEYGHWFDLWHTKKKTMPLVDSDNIMSLSKKSENNRMTAGQCYRANFSKDSYINKQGMRTGRTKNCDEQQDADNQCPGLKNEF